MEATELGPEEERVFAELATFPEQIAHSIHHYRFREALAQLMNVARLGNKYLADAEPWKVIKTDEERVKTVLNVSLQIASNLAILAQPFLPHTAAKMFDMLQLAQRGWENAGSRDLLLPGHQLGTS